MAPSGANSERSASLQEFAPALLGASGFFAQGVERRRAAALDAQASLQTGDIVRLASAVDGDTLVVTTAEGRQVAVRLLGVKAFSASRDKDPTTPYGLAAADALKQALAERPARVLAHDPPRDKYGRALATLFVEDRDVGLELVRKGHVLAYPVYPFPALSMYLYAQEQARAERKGLWGDPEMVVRADALAAEWRSGAPWLSVL